MRIGIVGAGRVAQSLGRLLYQHGAAITAVASRTSASAAAASTFIGPDIPIVPLSEIASWADHLLIAVVDDALQDVAAQLGRSGFSGTVLHTSGSRGLTPFSCLHADGVAVGVLHPLQTIPNPTQGVIRLPGSFFAVGGNPYARQWADAIVRTIGGHSLHISDSAWQLYHAAAVMVSNYPCALVDSALDLFSAIGIEQETARAALAPIIRAAIESILDRGPVNSLTGPISRGDVGTVRGHTQALAEYSTEIHHLYTAAGICTLRIAEKRGLPEASSAAIAAALTTKVS